MKKMAPLMVALVAFGPAYANECDVTVAEQATVTTVIDAGAFELADGRRARLAGIQPPRAAWPLAQEATANLKAKIAGKTIGLGYADRGTDRHGHLLAYVFVGDRWLQGELIDDGFARVASRSDTR